MNITGLHHVIAIASNPQRNLDFYVELLGLRLVKQTVNFDDPSSYHFYFGDAAGTSGTMLAFFTLPDLSGMPVLAVSGRYHPITPMDEAVQLVNLLRKAGAKVSESLENAGHGSTEATTVEITSRWLENLTPRSQYLNRNS